VVTVVERGSTSFTILLVSRVQLRGPASKRSAARALDKLGAATGPNAATAPLATLRGDEDWGGTGVATEKRWGARRPRAFVCSIGDGVRVDVKVASVP